MLNDVGPRLTQETLVSFVPQGVGLITGLQFLSLRTPLLGELSGLKIQYTTDLNTSGGS